MRLPILLVLPLALAAPAGATVIHTDALRTLYAAVSADPISPNPIAQRGYNEPYESYGWRHSITVMPPYYHEGSDAHIEQELYAGERPYGRVVGNGMDVWLTGWVTMPYEWHDATRWIDEYRYAIAGGTVRITFITDEPVIADLVTNAAIDGYWFPASSIASVALRGATGDLVSWIRSDDDIAALAIATGNPSLLRDDAHFQVALEPGTYELVMAIDLDSLGSHRPDGVWSATETVRLNAVLSFVPEPGTALLLVLGLAGLQRVARIRSE